MRLLSALLLCCLIVCPAAGQTVSELRTHVEYLASDELGGRYPASDGMQKAKDYVRAECKKLGLTTYTQDVATKAGTCQNVIAVLKGSRDDIRIVFSAHLDHLGEGRRGVYNGADDNASGSAAILALAKQAAEQPWGCTVEFIWYTAEEMGLIGSGVYVNRPIGEIDQYKLVLNLDMVGRLKGENRRGKFEYQDVVDELEKRYPFAEGLIYWGSGSDHKSWVDEGVPAITLNTGLHRDYHQPSDTADKINYEGMVKVCKYAMDFARTVDARLVPVAKPPVKPTPYILR